MTTTTQRVSAEHPYQSLGIVLVILALILVAFDLGVLARCGGGEGLCFDTSSHGTSDAALVAFFLVFVTGLILIMYTESTSSVTRTNDPVQRPPQVMVVNPPPTPSPTVIRVMNSPPPQPTTVTISPPRNSTE